MSLDNAKENLKDFGKELGLELAFDENNTCILGIDDEYSLHVTYEPNSMRMYVYSPLLDGLPKDDKIKLRLYEKLLEGSMLGGQMAGGGVGVAVKEELILVHSTLPMEHALPTALRAYAPIFLEMVERWRKMCKEVCEGRDEGSSKAAAPVTVPGAAGQAGPRPGSTGHGSGFIKI